MEYPIKGINFRHLVVTYSQNFMDPASEAKTSLYWRPLNVGTDVNGKRYS